MVGGQTRLSKSIALVSENWIVLDGDTGLGQQPFGLALRFFGERLSADIGVVLVGEVLDEGFPVPWVSVSYHFGAGCDRAGPRSADLTERVRGRRTQVAVNPRGRGRRLRGRRVRRRRRRPAPPAGGPRDPGRARVDRGRRAAARRRPWPCAASGSCAWGRDDEVRRAGGAEDARDRGARPPAPARPPRRPHALRQQRPRGRPARPEERRHAGGVRRGGSPSTRGRGRPAPGSPAATGTTTSSRAASCRPRS